MCRVSTTTAIAPKGIAAGSILKRAISRCLGFLPVKWERSVRRAYARHALAREPEPPEFAVLRHLIKDGYSVVDAGANQGIYTKFFSRYTRGEVISIEPIPSTFDILRANVTALKLHNVRLIRCALSDHTHTVTMEIPEDDVGRPVHYLARVKYSDPTHPPSRTHFSVSARTLDEVAAEAGARVALIKCDVEMHELEVLSGALSLLRRDAPAIYVEIQPDFATKKSQRQQIISMLDHEGYTPYVCLNGGVVRWNAEGANALDLLFLTDQHCIRLAHCGVSVSQS